jgi:hypothetical protein
MFTSDALEQKPFHLGQRCAPGKIVGILLPFMSVAVDVDGVFDFDVGRMNYAWLILGSRRIGSYTALLGRGGNDILIHGIGLL